MTKLYKVEDIIERTIITRQGVPKKEYRITATTPSDILFSVEIPGEEFTKTKADEVLTAKAQELEAIKAL